MTELRECPFCGGDVQAWEPPDCDFPHVSCLHCDARLDANTMPRAISAWNRRADDWQPIETAPRDGTRIMVSDGQNIWFDSQRVGKHAGPSNMGMPTTGHEFSRSGGKYPTHWRPLPKGPGR